MVIFILIYPLCSDAQDFSKIDSFARSVELNRMTLPQLTDSLTKPYHTDLEKVRSIFVWIAHNIAYDYQKSSIQEADSLAYLSNPLFDDKLLIKTILERRKGICYDYSFLFRAMCSLAGIESKMIKGFAKTSYKEIGVTLTKTNHAWNAVLIEGKWQLLDITWASERRYDEHTVEKLDEGYFLTPPSKLILDHWPEDENWQLLDKKVDRQKFFHFPHINSNYMKYNVQGFSPGNGLIPANGQEALISIKIAKTEREVRLVEGDQVLSEFIPAYENGSYKFQYSVSEETEGDQVSIAIQNADGSFDVILTYKLVDE
ncbi:MAG TPA: transglutaminase domain-containing protein [Saprospiraceae bacterium]|nr:transglutaminase domain-containing protein [Saprospiraceae bacterium]